MVEEADNIRTSNVAASIYAQDDVQASASTAASSSIPACQDDIQALSGTAGSSTSTNVPAAFCQDDVQAWQRLAEDRWAHLDKIVKLCEELFEWQ